MKKIVSLLLVALMVFSMTACAPKDKDTGHVSLEGKTPEELETIRAEIRNALSLVLDRNYIVTDIAQGGQVPASSFVAMGMTNPDGTEFYKTAGHNEGFDGYYNVDKAAFKANFDEAVKVLCKYYKYEKDSNGNIKFTDFPTLHYLYNTSEGHKAIAEYLQQAFASVGITMQLENQEWNTFLNTRKEGNYSIARNGWVADYNDPICFLDMWTTASGNNDIQFGKGAHKDLKLYNLDLTSLGYEDKVEKGTWAETYDVLISRIKGCSEPEKRFAMMHMAEDLLMETGCVTPLYFYTDLYMIDDTVEGFFSNPLGYKFFMNCKFGGKTDTMSVCIASEPDVLDPALNSAVDGATMDIHLFSGLAKWTQTPDGKFVIVPDAAEELPEGVANDDGTYTYTYTLKEGMKWSDGKPVTAKDFEFAWKRAASTGLAADYCYMYEIVKGYPDNLSVTALDDRTLEVVLTSAIPYWNEILAFPCFFPVREDVVANESWATDPSTFIGNGPYVMDTWEHNSLIVLKKNPNYHDVDNITMDELKFYLSDDANNMLSNFENGSWQLIDDVPTNEIANLKEKYPTKFVVAGQIGTYYVCWNVNEEILPMAK